MTVKKSSPESFSVEYDGFDGIDRSRVFPDSGGISDIVNFRVTGDRALKKRAALVKVATLNSKPRAYRELGGGNALLLMGNRFGVLDTNDFSFSTVQTVTTTSGAAKFFSYNGDIYLLDGDELYIYKSGRLSAVDGYAPLYGKDWDPILCGDIYERPNLLSNHLRISYSIKSGSPTRFMFNVNVSEINAVYVNGLKASTSKFIIEDGSMSAACGLTIEDGSTVVFYLTADSNLIQRSLVSSSTSAEIFGTNDNRGADVSSVAFFKPGISGKIACTQRITNESFAEATREYPNSVGMYVTDMDLLTVGDGTSSVNAVCRRGSRLLVFTQRETYALTESDKACYAFLLSSFAGCSAVGAALPMQNSPVTVSEIGILKWSPVSYDDGEYVAECISRPIDGLTGASFHTSAKVHLNRSAGELWFSDPSTSDNRVFIYNILLKAWYSYSNIPADSFFEANGATGVFSGNNVFVFDDSAMSDLADGEETPINARLVTGQIDFGKADVTKRLCRISMITDPGSHYRVVIKGSSGRLLTLSLSAQSDKTLGFINSRLSAERSEYYTVSITTNRASADSLHKLSLYAAH